MRDKKSGYLKHLFLFFFTLLCLSGIGMVYLDWIYSKINDKDVIIIDGCKDSNETSMNNEVLNILMLGVDELDGKCRGRTDAIMAVSVNTKTETIKLISLMRDLWVPIPGHGEGKLNWAYPKGGINLLSNVIFNQFGLRFDRYVIMDFGRFKYVIDQLGGVDLSLTKDEVNFINRAVTNKTKLRGSGLMHLDGDQALQFARDRDDPTADFKRTERQRELVGAIIKQVASKIVNENGVLSLISAVNNVMKSLKTNFSLSEAISLARISKKFINYRILTYRIPENYQSGMRNGHSVLISNLDECKKLLKKYIDGESNSDINQNISKVKQTQ